LGLRVNLSEHAPKLAEQARLHAEIEVSRKSAWLTRSSGSRVLSAR
jgi:hypothetical protein